ncbi:MAG: DeoR/GlpR transcriptional regulator [Pedobacter sp.]|nr:MAG: DeoR/GlpR transcriptional regulator [Pedobacter sp.]
MLREERQHLILEQIQLNQRVLTNELTVLLDVSLDTVRRDLTELEKAGKLVKVHGGALAKDYQIPFQPTLIYKQDEKIQIAKKAIELIQDDTSILLSGGTIILEVVKLIPKHFKGLIYTVSPLIALELAQRTQSKVILLGGAVTKESYICTGTSVMLQLANLQVDLCLMGANSFSIQHGLTEYDWELAHIKQAIINASKKSAVLSLAEKLDIAQEVKVCDIKQINYLVTDLKPDHPSLQKYKAHVDKLF